MTHPETNPADANLNIQPSADDVSKINIAPEQPVETPKLYFAPELPEVLRSPLQRAADSLKGRSYRDAMSYMFDFVEVSIPYLSYVLLAILGDEIQVVKDVVEAIDRKRPLSLGDWLNNIFTPLLIAARSARADNPVAASLAESIMRQNKNRLLGTKNTPSIVYLRNIYKGHSTTLADEICREVCVEIIPLISLITTGIQPLAAYREVIDGEIYRLVRRDEETTGETLENTPDNDPELAIIDLYPFVFCEMGHLTYVLHTLREEATGYISSNPLARPLDTEKNNPPLEARLRRINTDFHIERDLYWPEICKYARKQSDEFLAKIYAMRKYNRELFIERYALNNALEEFLSSDCTVFPLIGDAGQGKTTQLCYWTENLRRKNTPVLIFSGDEFTHAKFETKICRAFGASNSRRLEKLLTSINARAAENSSQLLIIIDAINECSSYPDASHDAPLALYHDIFQTINPASTPRIKILFTCRTFTWKNLLRPGTKGYTPEGAVFNASDDERYRIRGFNADEFARAYDCYRALYQMKTELADIDPRHSLRMRDPLVLKFVCTGYLGQSLSSNTLDYTSLSLFSKIIEDISHSYAGTRQCYILDRIGDRLLSCILAGKYTDSLSANALRSARNDSASPLHSLAVALYGTDGRSIAFSELINKPERPVLRITPVIEENDEKIQFVYERFMEYIIACAIDRLEGEPLQKIRDIFDKGGVNAVIMGAASNYLLMHCLKKGSAAIIIALAQDDDPNITALVSSIMNTLVIDNYEDQLFTLEQMLVTLCPGATKGEIDKFKRINKEIAANRATPEIIDAHKCLSAKLHATKRLRDVAITTTINGMLLTDFYLQRLYKKNPLDIVWSLIDDSITDVRDKACMYIYYLSQQKYTLQQTPIEENLTESIIIKLFGEIKRRNLVANAALRRNRSRTASFMENGTRLAVLSIIDSLMMHNDPDAAARMLAEIHSLASYLTGRFLLVRVVMPFLQRVMRKQITFQSDYCNNAIEYANFWDNEAIPAEGQPGKWGRSDMDSLVEHVHYHRQHVDNPDSETALAQRERFLLLYPKIADAYHKGDSFTFFGLERLMVIMGVTRWDNVAPLIHTFFSELYRHDQWFDYCQMSMLYSLYQIQTHSKAHNPELLDIYTRETSDWTRRCRGRYRAPRSDKANPRGLYKRNLLNWYADVYCRFSGDGVAHDGHETCAPLIYELIDEAAAKRDRELLYHIIDCTIEMVTDNRLINTALEVIKYILHKYPTLEAISEIESVTVERDGIYAKSFQQVLTDFLSTAKNYFPDEIKAFLREISGLPSPVIKSLSEDILNYNPAGETLGDLLTHKFGNFLMWALLYQEQVGDFAVEAMSAASHSKNCFAWYKNVVRIAMRKLFNVKV